MQSNLFLQKIALTLSFLLVNIGSCLCQEYVDFTTFLKNTTGAVVYQFSPDGKSLMYGTSKVDWENNRRKTEYYLYDFGSRSSRAITFKERNAVQPAWSPSGKYMSFIALSDTTGTSLPQLYIQEWPGGKATCITASRSGVSRFSWSPKEDLILFVAKDIVVKNQGTDRFLQAFEVGNNSYTTAAKPLSSHVYFTNIKTGTTKRLTSGDWTVQDESWISDSVILLIKALSPASGDLLKTEALSLNVHSGRTEAVAKEMPTLLGAKLSPRNNMLAVAHKKKHVPANIQEISLIGVKEQKSTNLTASFDRSISDYEWMPDGKSLVLQIADGLKTGLTMLTLDGKTKELALKDITGVGGVVVSEGGQIAFIGSTSTTLPEVYVFDPASTRLEIITSHNKFVREFTLGISEGVEWSVTGGMIADGVVTYPPNFQKNKKYPLVLYIHGGPTSASTINLNPFVQHLAAQGWIVFQPNYRGSLNRGNKFQSAISNDAGLGPGEDIIKGIEFLKRKGFVDEKKIAVTGWSYGGYMTAWLIGKYPTMWKAAVAGAAPVDITDMTTLTDLNVMIRHAITSSPWKGDNYKKYYQMSPISNLSKARTPTLVMSVVSDERVSITGSYKIYHALKANDVKVQFIAYPGAAHFPSDPVNSNDVYMRWTSWLKKYLD